MMSFRMNKRLIQSAFAICLIGGIGFSTAVAASDDDEDGGAIDFRQSVMTTFKWYIQPMGAMVKGKIPFDNTLFKSRAEGLADASRLDVTEGFPRDSVSDSNARTKIWDNWDNFKTRYKTLQKEALNLKQVADSGDQAAMKQQFIKTAKVCGSCHKEYRKKR